MRGANGSLVVTQNSNFTVAIVVQLNLLGNRTARARVTAKLVEQCRHCEGSVVGTENLGSQTLHVAVQVLVELRGLQFC